MAELLIIKHVTPDGKEEGIDIWKADEHGSANLTGLDRVVGTGSDMTDRAILRAARVNGVKPNEIKEKLLSGEIVKF
ncbi:MAG TPA: hypothetical protein VI819_02860 [Patescibacteria group bacterium]|nr:hypothetical protein [Patescibacteria group bacterium]